MGTEDISAIERATLYGLTDTAREYSQPEWATGMLKVLEDYQLWLAHEIWLDSLIRYLPWYQIRARDGAQQSGLIP